MRCEGIVSYSWFFRDLRDFLKDYMFVFFPIKEEPVIPKYGNVK